MIRFNWPTQHLKVRLLSRASLDIFIDILILKQVMSILKLLILCKF